MTVLTNAPAIHEVPAITSPVAPLAPPSLVLGCMAMTGSYGALPRQQALDTIARYLECGGRWIDTAALYADGENESLLEVALRGRRDHVVLCTKIGYAKTPEGVRTLDARPAAIAAECEASLRRLGTDCVDLLYLHRLDPNTPIEDSVGAMQRLLEAGKTRAIGLSEVSIETLDRALRIAPIAALQSEYSLWSREPERDVLVACRDRGVAFFGYAPLGRGFLSGEIRRPEDLPEGDQRRGWPRFQGENFVLNLALVDKVRSLAGRLGLSAAQLALAWAARTQSAASVPIVGATSADQVDEAFVVLQTPIDAGVWEDIERVFPFGNVAGERYPDAAMRRLGR